MTQLRAFQTLLVFSCVAFLALLSGCQTFSEVQDFQSLRLGMLKGQVTEIIGSPRTSQRRLEKDWWYYNLHDADGKVLERMVVFSEGKVIYAGRITTPKFIKAPEKVDDYNAKTDKGLDPATEGDRAKSNTLPQTPAPGPELEVNPTFAPEPPGAPVGQ